MSYKAMETHGGNLNVYLLSGKYQSENDSNMSSDKIYLRCIISSYMTLYDVICM